MKTAGVDVIPSYVASSSQSLWTDRADNCSGDFTLYDHLLDHSYNFGVIPERYTAQGMSPLDTYFGESARRAAGIELNLQPWAEVVR